VQWRFINLSETVLFIIIIVFIGIHECFAFQEVIYQRALAIEFSLQKIDFQRELEMLLHYKGENIGTRRVDFFVENQVMVEIKAIEKLEGVHKAQAINYCEAYNIADGLLINFGGQSLQFHRIYNKKLK
jgi:GxxExxY protein